MSFAGRPFPPGEACPDLLSSDTAESFVFPCWLHASLRAQRQNPATFHSNPPQMNTGRSRKRGHYHAYDSADPFGLSFLSGCIILGATSFTARKLPSAGAHMVLAPTYRDTSHICALGAPCPPGSTVSASVSRPSHCGLSLCSRE